MIKRDFLLKWRAAVISLFLVLAVATDTRAQQVSLDVRDFVRHPSFPASYRELSGSYDSSVVPQLIEMLNSTAEEGHWGRIASLLGAVGDDRAVDALIAFVEKPVVTLHLSLAHEDAHKAAIMSLGLLTNRTGDERALKYLIDGLTPNVWRQRQVDGIPVWTTSYEEYDRELSKYALFGLALSGHPRAGEALRALQESPTLGQAQFRSGLDNTLAQWLEVHQLVAETGVAGMYDYYETERFLKEAQQSEEAQRLREQSAERQRLREAQQPRPRELQ